MKQTIKLLDKCINVQDTRANVEHRTRCTEEQLSIHYTEKKLLHTDDMFFDEVSANFAIHTQTTQRKKNLRDRTLTRQSLWKARREEPATWPDSVNVDELKSTGCLPMSLPPSLSLLFAHSVQSSCPPSIPSSTPRDRPVYIVVQLGPHRFGTGGSSRRFASLLDSRRNCDGICVIFH